MAGACCLAFWLGLDWWGSSSLGSSASVVGAKAFSKICRTTVRLQVRWHATLDAVPEGPHPTLYIAHEFFDALPVHQFVRDGQRGWLEKMVDVVHDEDDSSGEGRPAEQKPGGEGDGEGGGGKGGSGGQGRVSGSGLRLVLSPAPTPASALLVPRRLAGMDKETAEKVKALEVRGTGDT